MSDNPGDNMKTGTTPNIPDTLSAHTAPIGDLQHYHSNPRRGNLDAIKDSLARHGQYRPIVANKRTSQVLAGNHTLAAARDLGWAEIAVTWVDVDEDAAARIVLVDNRTNDLAEYDDSSLLDLLQSLPSLDGTGYDTTALAELLASASEEPTALTDPDEAPSPPQEDPHSQEGDVWLLGPHRVLCGDSTDAGAVALMLDGDQPDCVWTDPPYGVSYVGRTADALTIQNDGKGDLPELLLGAFSTLAAVCRPGAPVYVAHADTERMIFEQSMLDAGLLVRQNLVWVKNALVLGRSDYHYKHEPILEGQVAAEDDEGSGPDHEPLLYGFTPGGSGRLGRGGPNWLGDDKQTTVFDFPKPKRSAEHPTMKPTELVVAMLKNSCAPGGLVLDLFGGSGSTLIAAHHHRARAALVELDARYVDVICRRYQEHTGTLPILEATGKTHDFTKEQ